ncbi:hypothetical protein K461DRAFT_277401 [Myriangium duriaei CBS 260.36]|uniref:Uncharacterized protein n=1 Tax=Myriangium duriaei CBS 260.36 TaxID=1168546 RepID=A0A9P4MLK0_9PEZI|nr:hypothetical protein K461DRAFT_277401 [Myriangium duriaei CBS 260.36]
MVVPSQYSPIRRCHPSICPMHLPGTLAKLRRPPAVCKHISQLSLILHFSRLLVQASLAKHLRTIPLSIHLLGVIITPPSTSLPAAEPPALLRRNQPPHYPLSDSIAVPSLSISHASTMKPVTFLSAVSLLSFSGLSTAYRIDKSCKGKSSLCHSLEFD